MWQVHRASVNIQEDGSRMQTLLCKHDTGRYLKRQQRLTTQSLLSSLPYVSRRHPAGRLHCCDHIFSSYQASTPTGNIFHLPLNNILLHTQHRSSNHNMATNRNQSISGRERQGSEFWRGRCPLKLYDIPEDRGEGVLGWSGLLCSTMVPEPSIH